MAHKKLFIIMIIMIAALALRIYAVAGITDIPADDAAEYDKLALNIMSGKGYVNDEGMPTSFRPPLYPLILSVIYGAFGHSYLIVRVLQAILGTITVFLIYLIGRDIYSEKAGMLAAAMAAVYPSYIKLTGLLFTEGLFMFLLALSVYLLLVMRRRLRADMAVMTGLTLGLLSLTRPSAVLLPAVYIVAILIFAWRKYLKRALYMVFLISAAYAAVLAPWVYRNFIVHKAPVIVSSNGGLNFYQSVTPAAGKIFGKVPEDANIEKWRMIKPEAAKDSFLFRKAVEKIASDPLQCLRLTFVRFLFYWGFYDWEVQTGKEYNFIYASVLPFFFFGAIYGILRVKDTWLLLGVIAYFSALVLLSQGTVRYRLPTDGYLFIIGSYSIFTMLEKQKHKLTAAFCIAAIFIMNYYLYLRSEWAKDILRRITTSLGLW